MADEKKPLKIRIPKKPEFDTWFNDKGFRCRKCKWCPGTMILKST